MRRLEIYPNAYYNYRKNRKAGYCAKKSEVHRQIAEIYHSHNGIDGYRSMTVYLERRGYHYSSATIHKYMNRELGLRSIVRPKKPGTKPGKPHRVFENLLKQDFQADRPNQKWCTDFTYLFLENGDVRYNCTILDLYDRSVIASITDRHITSDLAVRTLQKALDSHQHQVGHCAGGNGPHKPFRSFFGEGKAFHQSFNHFAAPTFQLTEV